jgi:hypothetical protein
VLHGTPAGSDPKGNVQKFPKTTLQYKVKDGTIGPDGFFSHEKRTGNCFAAETFKRHLRIERPLEPDKCLDPQPASSSTP